MPRRHWRWLGALVALSVGGWLAYDLLTRVRVRECYALDMVVADASFHNLKAVALGLRTWPKADGLDLQDLEIVAPDGQRFTDVHLFTIGRESWLVIPVSEKYVAGGGLKLWQKASGRTTDLPPQIEPKRIHDLE